MDRAGRREKREGTQLGNQRLKLCLPLERLRGSSTPNPFSVLGFWVSRNLRNLYNKAAARFSQNGFCCSRRFEFNGNVVNNSVFFISGFCTFLQEEEEEERRTVMEFLGDKREEKSEGFGEKVSGVETFGDLIAEKGRESSSSSDFLTSETTGHEEEHSHSSSEESSSSPTTLGWPVEKKEAQDCASQHGKESAEEKRSEISDIELMKERFSKLLLGEDMSGCGNGVSTALAISNAITNLCATLFGQLWRLQPLPQEKKLMWRREMEWLLCVSDHIVELIPSWQTFPDGSKLEVMTCRPRADLYVNLPALRKLDSMLLEILDGFEDTEFWYADQGILGPDADGSSSFQRTLQRQEEKWWLPVPRVPPGGLKEDTRQQLQHKRDCTNQILKAAMAINTITLADIAVPESYLESLPKNGKICLGDLIYRYISSEQFYPECLLDCLDLSSDHQAIEIANRVEASMYMWRRKVNSKPCSSNTRSSARSSWEMVKELMMDAEKRELLAERAESLLFCLKQRFPGLSQTALDMSKIQYNKDVGKSILESYSRVLESLAFNIVARIDDLLYVDDLTKHSDQFSSISKVGLLAQNGAPMSCSVPVPNTPYKTAFTTPSFSPAHLVSPARGDRSPFITSSKIPQRGLGVKKVLTDYLNIEAKINVYGSPNGKADSVSKTVHEVPASQAGTEPSDSSKTTSQSIQDRFEKDGV